MRPGIIFSIVFIFSFHSGFGQKKIEYREQAWAAYFNQTRFTKHSGLWVDLHHRTTGNFFDESATNITRFGYVYFLTDAVRLSAGHAFVRFYSNTAPDFTEQRPWQQVQWFGKHKYFNSVQALRLEERYRPKIASGEVTDDYNFNWRLRYNASIAIPLYKQSGVKGNVFLSLNNEVHVNAGKAITFNVFDQNRFFAGLGYQIMPNLNAHLGYLNVFQQAGAPGSFISINAIRLFVFHNLDLRNKD